ncbi:MAG: U32 family peptidase [Clostridia bacterium]|nr:U32 family peptidase [Clostridia bacterium]
MTGRRLPELLAPAGTREALDAAIHAGADAVYFGGSRFNARMNADNFDDRAMEDAINTCAFYGVKSNITLNTLPTERELPDVLSYAEKLCRWGADAIICADLGTAVRIHRYFPELELHASTQCAGHNTGAAEFFASLGFSRMVAARELSFENLRTLCEASPIETELFIHGALCVSQSGGCLFSSLVGGRSGNRGACAQPCRLPYALSDVMHPMLDAPQKNLGRMPGKPSGGAKSRQTSCQNSPASRPAEDAGDYPLSLKDYCLARHIPELLSLGAASLKIEGRMKGPAYVAGVVRVWRRLLDEGRNADEKEMALLSGLFSRGGSFTDAYFRGVTGVTMRGIRTDEDKAATEKAEKLVTAGRREGRRIPCEVACAVRAGEEASLSLAARGVTVSVSGPVPAPAENRATTEDDVRGAVTKLGATPFSVQTLSVSVDAGLSLPLSALNAMRRDAAQQLEAALKASIGRKSVHSAKEEFSREQVLSPAPFSGEYAYARQASFLSIGQIPPSAKDFYAVRYLPLAVFCADADAALATGVNGIVMPPVVFDSEWNVVCRMLSCATEHAVSHGLVTNPGQFSVLSEYPFVLHGDLRLNLWTAQSADVYGETGLSDVLLSPELSLPQMRDIKSVLPRGAVTYGRLPMMTLQRCIQRERLRERDNRTQREAMSQRGTSSARGAVPEVSDTTNPCTRCDSRPVSYLIDRKHTAFPVTRLWPHRNIVWNSAPVWMADRRDDLLRAELSFEHHMFTTESRGEVEKLIAAYDGRGELTPPSAFRRM